MLKLLLLCLLIQYEVCVADFNVVKFYESDQVLPKTLQGDRDKNFAINVITSNIEIHDAFSTMQEICTALLVAHPIAILGPSSRTNLQIVQDVCAHKNIPLILTEWVGDLKRETEISFYPSIELLTSAYMDIILYLKWKHFTILYTNPQDFTKFTKVLQAAGDSKIGSNIEYIDPENLTQIRTIADKLRRSNEKYFIVDCPVNKLKNILQLFQTYGLINKGYSYFFISITIDIVQADEYSFLYDFTITGADIYNLVNYIDFTRLSPDIKNVLQNVSTIEEALSIDAILMLGEVLTTLETTVQTNISCENDNVWDKGEEILNYMLTQTYHGITGLIELGSDRYRSTFSVTIFKVKPNFMQNIGTWDSIYGLYINSSSNDLKIRHFIVEMTLLEPYTMLKSTPNMLGGNDRYEGFAVDLIEELSKMNNFTYSIVIRADSHNGVFDNVHGRWSGMIGDLLDQRADMAISDLTITSERIEAVDFTIPFMYSGISILFQKPMKVPPSFFEFAAPFSCELWIGIALAFVTVSVSLFIIGRLCKNEWRKQCPDAKHTISQLTFCNAVWFSAGSLFKQNTRVHISSIPGRIIAAVWWMFCFVLVAAYIVGLISYFSVSVNERELPVTLFDDIVDLVDNAEKYGIRYGAKKSSATMEFFKNSDDIIFQQVYRHMVENPEDMVSTIDKGIQRTLNERYAFITESSVIEYVKERHCQLDQYGNILEERAFGIALRKNSPYLKQLSVSILQLISSGKLEALKNRWWTERNGGGQCYYEIQDIEVSPIELYRVAGLIHLIILGMTVAVISAIIELLIHVYKLNKVLKIGYGKIFISELKGCVKRNVKKGINYRLTSASPLEKRNILPESVELR